MGFAVSKASNRQSSMIDRQLKLDGVAEAKSIKLLLLGPGESGKSTIVKQMRILHLSGFRQQELDAQTLIARQCVLKGIVALIEAMSKLRIPYAIKSCESEAAAILHFVAHWDTQPAMGLPMEIAVYIRHVWHDAGVEVCFKRSNEYQLEDSAKYFLDSCERICATDYRPTQEDILRTRVQTTGISEARFSLGANTVRVFDVGGQKSQRRKWLHCFDNVHAVVFVAAISEYDQTLREDDKTNRLVDAITLFKTVCNCCHFLSSEMILFLNKKDIFAQKILTRSVTQLFSGYKGPPHDCLASSIYVLKKFKAQNKIPEKRIYHHFTCATDTAQMNVVINATTDIILNGNVKSAFS